MKNFRGDFVKLKTKLESKENGVIVVFSCNTCPFVVGSSYFPGWENQYNALHSLAQNNDLGFVLINSNEAKRDGVDMKYYSIIYELIDDVKNLLSGLLKPDISEKITGNVEIREVFNISKIGNIAGCMVKDGLISRNSKIRLLRDNVVVHTGTLASLKRFKDEVKEVKSGFECGLMIENYSDIKIGDVIETYEEVKTERKL